MIDIAFAFMALQTISIMVGVIYHVMTLARGVRGLDMLRAKNEHM